MIVTIRTDKPEAEVGLYDKNGTQKTYKIWEAHRQLSETIHGVIEELLTKQSLKWNEITGVVFFEGPGSFTGLRIGAAVANALGSAISVPVVSAGGDNWIDSGLKKLRNGQNGSAVPEYGSPVYITKQKK